METLIRLLPFILLVALVTVAWASYQIGREKGWREYDNLYHPTNKKRKHR